MLSFRATYGIGCVDERSSTLPKPQHRLQSRRDSSESPWTRSFLSDSTQSGSSSNEESGLLGGGLQRCNSNSSDSDQERSDSDNQKPASGRLQQPAQPVPPPPPHFELLPQSIDDRSQEEARTEEEGRVAPSSRRVTFAEKVSFAEAWPEAVARRRPCSVKSLQNTCRGNRGRRSLEIAPFLTLETDMSASTPEKVHPFRGPQKHGNAPRNIDHVVIGRFNDGCEPNTPRDAQDGLLIQGLMPDDESPLQALAPSSSVTTAREPRTRSRRIAAIPPGVPLEPSVGVEVATVYCSTSGEVQHDWDTGTVLLVNRSAASYKVKVRLGNGSIATFKAKAGDSWMSEA